MDGLLKTGRLVFVFLFTLLGAQHALAQQEGTASSAAQQQQPSVVNLNTATLDELQSLRGVGAKTAEAIVAWREEHGPFVMTDQLMAIRGIGPKTYQQLSPRVTVGE